MKVCILDGKILENKEILHDVLTDTLNLPEWYGRNLDALYDCLTDVQEETEICIKNESFLKEHLGNYAVVLMKVIARSAKENERIKYRIEE